MPVQDHEVHVSVVKTDTLYHSCQNKKRASSYLAQDGWHLDGRARLTTVVNPMSQRCRYDMRGTDTGCRGCQQPKENFEAGGWK